LVPAHTIGRHPKPFTEAVLPGLIVVTGETHAEDFAGTQLEAQS
jgi:hypothetical protein